MLLLTLRPWWRLGAVVAAVLAFGLATQAMVEAFAPTWTGGPVIEGGRLGDLVSDWVIIPTGHDRFGSVVYVALVVTILALSRLRGWHRTIALVPAIYLAAIVWENSFVEQPAVARWILFGSLLVVLMTVRPQGLLGTPRVEIA
jgi:hypothetical protein